jgi:RHS repeat-associated protein
MVSPELPEYVYGPGIDDVLKMDYHDGANTYPYYYHKDGLGSVTELTDVDGALVQAYEYDAGNASRCLDEALLRRVSRLGGGGTPTIYDTDCSVIRTANPYLYTGRRWDADIALYYYRARHYAPHLGRFIQPDPIGFGQGPNLYAYVGNAPTAYVDAFGLKRVEDRILYDTFRWTERKLGYVSWTENLGSTDLGIYEEEGKCYQVTETSIGHYSAELWEVTMEWYVEYTDVLPFWYWLHRRNKEVGAGLTFGGAAIAVYTLKSGNYYASAAGGATAILGLGVLVTDELLAKRLMIRGVHQEPHTDTYTERRNRRLEAISRQFIETEVPCPDPLPDVHSAEELWRRYLRALYGEFEIEIPELKPSWPEFPMFPDVPVPEFPLPRKPEPEPEPPVKKPGGWWIGPDPFPQPPKKPSRPRRPGGGPVDRPKCVRQEAPCR